jgi:hypothetical protein
MGFTFSPLSSGGTALPEAVRPVVRGSAVRGMVALAANSVSSDVFGFPPPCGRTRLPESTAWWTPTGCLAVVEPEALVVDAGMR